MCQNKKESNYSLILCAKTRRRTLNKVLAGFSQKPLFYVSVKCCFLLSKSEKRLFFLTAGQLASTYITILFFSIHFFMQPAETISICLYSHQLDYSYFCTKHFKLHLATGRFHEKWTHLQNRANIPCLLDSGIFKWADFMTDFSKKKNSNTSVRITALHFTLCFKIHKNTFGGIKLFNACV